MRTFLTEGLETSLCLLLEKSSRRPIMEAFLDKMEATDFHRRVIQLLVFYTSGFYTIHTKSVSFTCGVGTPIELVRVSELMKPPSTTPISLTALSDMHPLYACLQD